MGKIDQIYEGKAKKLFTTEDADVYIQEFKDDATAFDATKKGTITDKGVVNNKISTKLFQLLETKGIPTHFIECLNDRDMAVKKVEIVPLEVTMRNIVAGGMAKLLGLDEGIILDEPVFEYHYKEDALHDPLINNFHIKALKIATSEELDKIQAISFKINDILIEFFASKKLDLVDFKLEFGRCNGEIILADEISPDTCRLWEKKSKRKMDKDRFRRDLGNIEETYQEVLKLVVD
ncbi:MAG: phosphoribosylaminoimidazolesuccinocarboxamide synthase [Candidatus Orphnella occulta]|nr:phosphoribosylaminoimidazolesuccinocarboxamide synthase [Candidatus Orphnella occulta]